ncbi:MAG: hypothetical protein FWE71_02195 [Nocardioidaceae bacterium]|nr:hypothetical protein [Nocardioidaceae bacterium]MCL2611596.1 hypothetical protein [Nocardioidaceae bacterium]
MEDVNRGEMFAATNETAAWAALEQALVAYVGGMTDPSDHLDLEVPGNLCACFTAADSGDVQLTLPDLDTQQVRSRERAADLAAAAVVALRDQMHLAHPHLLTISASGPQAALRGMLGLEDSDDVPHEPGGPAAPVVITPSGRDDLNAAIAEALTKKYAEEPTVDSDGDFVLSHMGQTVWVHAFDDQPAVRIMARVAHDVRSRRQAAVELAILNRNSVFVDWALTDRDVWQRITFPAGPFAPDHLDEMLRQFFAAMSETRDDLALRLGATVA